MGESKIQPLRAPGEQTCTAQLQADAINHYSLGDIYMYEFSRVRPGIGGQRIGAYHGAELPYVFNNHDSWLSSDEVDEALTESIMNYWVNFAKTGNPNGTGLTQWPQYTSGSRKTLELGDRIGVIDAPNHRLCALMKPPQP